MTRKTKKSSKASHKEGSMKEKRNKEIEAGQEPEPTKAEKQEVKDDKKEEAVKPKHQTLYFIIFAAALLLIFLGIVLIPKYLKQIQFEKDKYNNFEFIQQDDGFWYTMLQRGAQPYWVPFYYHPRELEDIAVETNLRNKFFAIRDNNGSIFITLDPDSDNNTIVIAGVEIAKIIGPSGLLKVPTHAAFIKAPSNASTETATPIVTCNNANAKIMVIWLTLSDKNIAYSQGNCVMLESKSYTDMVKVADRLMYHLLGVMN
jgi:hypothetical protein